MWQPISNVGSAKAYTSLLCQFIRAIAKTEANPERFEKFNFHLTATDKSNLSQLKSAVQNSNPKAAIMKLHNFVRPLFYPNSSPVQSRWDDPLERFYALRMLNADGTFKEAKDLTKTFAIIEYHIRSVMFYEGWLQSQAGYVGIVE